MTKVTLHESYVLVETDDIDLSDLREAVSVYLNEKSSAEEEAELLNKQPEVLALPKT